MKHYGLMSDHATTRRRRKSQATRPGRQESLWQSIFGGLMLVLAIITWTVVFALLSV